MIDATTTPTPETFKDSYVREQQQTDQTIDSTEKIQESFLQ
jgi:hypothetical protein